MPNTSGSTPFFPASGPATSSFNGLHLKSKFLAMERWVESRVLAGDFGVLLLAVLDAWALVVLALAERDLSLWADEVIQDSFR